MSNSYTKYVHVHQVRGLTSPERNVFVYLYDQANGDGEIPRLYSRTIAYACGLGRRRVFEVLASLEEKEFITERIQRRGRSDGGAYKANGYQIDMGRFHPPGPGAELGGVLLRLMSEEIEIPEHVIDAADAYLENRLLSLWFPIPNVCSVLYENRTKLLESAQTWGSFLRNHEPPEAFEFLHPKGQVSTPMPRDRGAPRLPSTT